MSSAAQRFDGDLQLPIHTSITAASMRQVAGCTVHFATNEYDAGPIIVQRVCRVEARDTADDVAAKVFREECAAYPEAVALFLDGRLLVKDGIVHILARAPPLTTSVGSAMSSSGAGFLLMAGAAAAAFVLLRARAANL